MAEFLDPIVLTGVVGTAALAGLTGFYAVETRRIRRSTELPSFYLDVSMSTVAGDILHMDLVNTGQIVTDVRIDCTWPGGNKKFYAFSLSTHGHISLSDVPFLILAQNLDTLMLKIKCKDVRASKHTVKLEMDFGIAKSEGRQLTYEYKPKREDSE